MAVQCDVGDSRPMQCRQCNQYYVFRRSIDQAYCRTQTYYKPNYSRVRYNCDLYVRACRLYQPSRNCRSELVTFPRQLTVSNGTPSTPEHHKSCINTCIMERTRFMLIVLRFDTQISGVGLVVDLLSTGERLPSVFMPYSVITTETVQDIHELH